MFFKFWILPNTVQFSQIGRFKEKQHLVTLNFHKQVFSVSQIGRWLANISRSLNLPDQWDYVCWHVNKNKNRNKKFSSKNENVFCRITKTVHIVSSVTGHLKPEMSWRTFFSGRWAHGSIVDSCDQNFEFSGDEKDVKDWNDVSVQCKYLLLGAK